VFPAHSLRHLGFSYYTAHLYVNDDLPRNLSDDIRFGRGQVHNSYRTTAKHCYPPIVSSEGYV